MSGGGKYTWEAHDKKAGMTAAELESALKGAKTMFGEKTPLTATARVGWRHQLEAITFGPTVIPEPIRGNQGKVHPQARPA